jgi:hypothetical protein
VHVQDARKCMDLVSKIVHVQYCTLYVYPPTAHGEARKVRGACLTDAHTRN